jgi:hypothetical protein
MLGPVPALEFWMWRLIDACVAGDEQDGEPATLTDDERATAGELEPVVEAACDLWRKRSDDAVIPADAERVRGLCRAAGHITDGIDALLAFLERGCALVGVLAEQRSRDADGKPDAHLGWGHWTHDVPRVRPTIDLDLLERLSDACWELYVSACAFNLAGCRTELTELSLRLSRDAFVAAGHLRRWDRVVVHRGRHHALRASGRRAASTQVEHHSHVMLHRPHPIPQEIGCALARLHDREQELLGPGIAVTPAAVAVDVLIHARPRDADVMTGFAEGYAYCSADPERLEAAATTDRARPRTGSCDGVLPDLVFRVGDGQFESAQSWVVLLQAFEENPPRPNYAALSSLRQGRC